MNQNVFILCEIFVINFRIKLQNSSRINKKQKRMEEKKKIISAMVNTFRLQFVIAMYIEAYSLRLIKNTPKFMKNISKWAHSK